MEATLPQNETKRLEVLNRYKILDTPRESDFDDLVRLAAQICQTPISLVSLVDRDRQWFKGRYGLEIPETPRQLSFCAHTILHPEEAMEVPDATQDPRFADNELVTGDLKLRYYAGAPLVTPDGYALGTLCVIDKRPRHLSPEQKEALRILSRQVMMQLELRRRMAELERIHLHLVEANINLQSFTNTAAHDLRSPLRTIRSFSNLALAENCANLNENCRAYLARVAQAAEQMDRLMTDLLEFSRMTQEELKLQPISLRKALSDTLGFLDADIRARKARVTLGESLPEVLAHPATIVLILNNLVSNALKFVPQEVRPEVRIWAEESKNEGTARIWVEDNGIGINVEDQNKIFGVFQRLHGKQEYPGTGLGLAIARRGAERMGGRVGVESQLGHGSRFWVELRAVTA